MRGLMSAVVAAVAIVLQLAVADRIAFPGGTGPDLVLVTVAALALATGPMAGAVAGFCAGLALDVAPPAGHLVGQDALVFCLVGYAAGFIATSSAADGAPEHEHSALFEIGITAAGAACGEAMAAVLGVMLSDPRVTWAAVKHVLPVAIGYDLLLSPFVLFAVAAMLRLAGAVMPRGDELDRVGLRGAAGSGDAARRRAAWNGVPQSGAVRQMAGGSAPRLRLSGQSNWLGSSRGGARGSASKPGPTRTGLGGRGLSGREPRLKLGRGSSGGMAGSAFTATRTRPGGHGGHGGHGGQAKVKFGGRRGEGVLGGSLLGGAAGSRLAGSRLGASLLGGSVFRRPAPVFGRSSGLSGRAKAGGAHIGPGPHAPRFRKASTLGRLAQVMRRPAQRKSPGRRWLRGTSSSRSSPARRGLARRGLGRGGLVRGGPGGRAPGRGWLRRSGGMGSRLRRRAPRLGSGRGRNGPARLRMRPRKLTKSWRRTGGYR